MLREPLRVLAMGLLFVTSGCGDESGPAAADNPSNAANDTEQHGHGSGLHGGVVTDLGRGAYHAEFTVNHDTQEATVYVMGSDAKTAAAIKADKILLSIDDPAFQVELMPLPMESEVDGTSSRFVGKHENLGIVQEFSGKIRVTIDGDPYLGEFAELAASN